MMPRRIAGSPTPGMSVDRRCPEETVPVLLIRARGTLSAGCYRTSDGAAADLLAETLGPEVGHLVEEGIGGAYVAAGQLGDDGPALLDAAQQAFLDGWFSAMWFAATIAVGAAVTAAALIPGRKSNEHDNARVVDVTPAPEPALAFAGPSD